MSWNIKWGVVKEWEAVIIYLIQESYKGKDTKIKYEIVERDYVDIKV